VQIDQGAIERGVAALVGYLPAHPFVTPVGHLHKPRQTVVSLKLPPGPIPQVRVEADAEGDVAFKDGALVVPTLNQIGLRVEGVIRHLASTAGWRPPP
jgi:hypothetical protein